MVFDAAVLPWALLQAALWLVAQLAGRRIWGPAAVWGVLAAQVLASLLFWGFLAGFSPPDEGPALAPQWAGTAVLALALNVLSAVALARIR